MRGIVMTVWEDEETGEVHWHKSEYADLIARIFRMETDIMKLKQELEKLKARV